jgi:hypothetical protein
MRNTALLRSLCAAAACALAAPAAAGPRDSVYQWTDAAGAVRYTTVRERIPEDSRGSAVVVVAAPDAARTPERPAAQPVPASAPRADATPAPVESAPPAAPVVDEKVSALDARIAELEKSIAADEAALGDYISDPERAAKQRESGEVAAIADRLPRLQSELRELKKQREAATGAAPHDEP